MPEEKKQQSFLRDVAEHAIEVVRDDGVYRHIRLKKPGTTCMHFDLITWPGYLCYTGDMGTYVFQRLRDMFEFFRTDQQRANPGELRINLSYWSEKLTAVDGSRHAGSATEFSEEKFTKVIKEQLVTWMRESGLNREGRSELRKSIEEDVLYYTGSGDEHRLYRAANEFSAEIDGQEFQFEDLWDHDFTEYTHRFVWCCYALTWGIQQYDALKTVAPAAEVAA
ncbi:MAG: hypothetical protein K2Y25_07430 [Pseudomonadaceae bacterium]|nr:hypothetical protein [Pseudomonadaceae bacterium]